MQAFSKTWCKTHCQGCYLSAYMVILFIRLYLLNLIYLKWCHDFTYISYQLPLGMRWVSVCMSHMYRNNHKSHKWKTLYINAFYSLWDHAYKIYQFEWCFINICFLITKHIKYETVCIFKVGPFTSISSILSNRKKLFLLLHLSISSFIQHCEFIVTVLMAPSHYLSQCWLIISKVKWHWSKGKFTRDNSAIYHWNYLEN